MEKQHWSSGASHEQKIRDGAGCRAFLPATTLRAAQTEPAGRPKISTVRLRTAAKNSGAGQTPLPMSTEPAFSFKALMAGLPTISSSRHQ
jgi:hypothetical protein